jgi:hypothetical protein
MKSRMTRERHVRFRESLGVKFLGATRPLAEAEKALSPAISIRSLFASDDRYPLLRL